MELHSIAMHDVLHSMHVEIGLCARHIETTQFIYTAKRSAGVYVTR